MAWKVLWKGIARIAHKDGRWTVSNGDRSRVEEVKSIEICHIGFRTNNAGEFEKDNVSVHLNDTNNTVRIGAA